MQERVILLGPTGIEKKDVIKGLSEFAKTQAGQWGFEWVDFEHSYLGAILTSRDMEFPGYMDAPDETQRELWLAAWQELTTAIHVNSSDRHILLGLHAVITRLTTGTRCSIDIPSVVAFRPTKVFVLIDDIYMMWRRTEERARGQGYKGRPSLVQLLDARRAELLVGSLIARHVSPKPRLYVLAVRHPARALFRLIFGKEVRPTYLSFPITGPRLDLRAGDESGIREVNNFIRMANSWEHKTPNLVCLCPLTIDEYPLLRALESPQKQQDKVVFPLGMRWNVREFWKDEILLFDEAKTPGEIVLEEEEVRAAAGMIVADVGLRDYQLVRQSRRLAVLNPWYRTKGADNAEPSSGVLSEIMWQEKQHHVSRWRFFRMKSGMTMVRKLEQRCSATVVA